MKHNKQESILNLDIALGSILMVIMVVTILFMDFRYKHTNKQPTCSEKYPDQKTIDIDGDCYLLVGDKLNTYVHESKFDNNVSTISTFEYKPLIIQK